MIDKLKLMIALSATVVLAACGPSRVAVTISETPPPAAGGPTASTADPETRLQTLAARPLKPGETASLPGGKVTMPRAGETNAYGLTVTQDMEAAYDAYLAGDGEAALAAIGRASKKSNDTGLEWHLSALCAQVLIAMGRASDADDELDRTLRLERQSFGRDIFARALRGEALVWTGDYDRAVEELTAVAAAVKDWRLPTSYGLPPSNIAELVYVTTAQLRTYTALAGQFLLRNRIAEALSWSQRAETLFADVHYVADHMLYGRYLSVHADSFYGRALNLSFLGAAKVVANRDMAAGLDEFRRPNAFYEALGYRPGVVTTTALRAWSALVIGDVARAESEAAKAVELALDAELADLTWRVQALRGEALLAAGRVEEAEQVLRSAEAAVDTVSGALSSDRAKRRFGIGKSDLTYRLVQFDIASNDLDQLFTDLERARARAFVDMLAGVRVPGPAVADTVAGIERLDGEIRRLRLVNASRGGAG